MRMLVSRTHRDGRGFGCTTRPHASVRAAEMPATRSPTPRRPSDTLGHSRSRERSARHKPARALRSAVAPAGLAASDRGTIAPTPDAALPQGSQTATPADNAKPTQSEFPGSRLKLTRRGRENQGDPATRMSRPKERRSPRRGGVGWLATRALSRRNRRSPRTAPSAAPHVIAIAGAPCSEPRQRGGRTRPKVNRGKADSAAPTHSQPWIQYSPTAASPDCIRPRALMRHHPPSTSYSALRFRLRRDARHLRVAFRPPTHHARRLRFLLDRIRQTLLTRRAPVCRASTNRMDLPQSSCYVEI
jgi:hypothetical protein